MPSNLGRKPDAERHFALTVKAFESKSTANGAFDVLRVWAEDNLRQAMRACRGEGVDMEEYYRAVDRATDCLVTANKVKAAVQPKKED